jgi:hypothetical protein
MDILKDTHLIPSHLGSDFNIGLKPLLLEKTEDGRPMQDVVLVIPG